MQDGYGLHLWRDSPWRGGGRQQPSVRVYWYGMYKLFAIEETVGDKFTGAESCTVVGLQELVHVLR
jgi:hypothetical protein